MILLDTNVISEAWKSAPDPRVLDWIDSQALETLYLSAVTVAELRYGIALMPVGRRRDILDQRLAHEVLPLFEGRILAFDLRASRAYADLMAKAREADRAIGMADGYIAATASVHQLTVATRDAAPFSAAGISIINPWQALR